MKLKKVLFSTSVICIILVLLYFIYPTSISKDEVIYSICIRQYKAGKEFNWTELKGKNKKEIENILLEMDLRRTLEVRTSISARNNPIQLEVVMDSKVLFIVLGENNNIVNLRNNFEQYKIINGKDIYCQIKGIIEND